jgi:hypothetical protein
LEPIAQLRPAAMPRDTTYRDGYGFLLAHQNDEPLPASDAGVEQVTLQHRVVLTGITTARYSEPWIL